MIVPRQVPRATLGAILLAHAALAAPGLAQTGEPTRLLRFPDLSGDRIAFTYAGDIWLASTDGGTATRLTSHPGLELFAKFSPDGAQIAFTGQYDGDEQVYVVPTAGSAPSTDFYPAAGPLAPRWGYDYQVYGWSPDGKSYVSGGDYEAPDRPRAALLGARFELDEDAGRYRIAHIFEGQNEEPRYRSPLTEIGVGIGVGDYLFAIQGRELTPATNPFQLLREAGRGPLELTTGSSADRGEARNVFVDPISSEDALIYLACVIDEDTASDGDQFAYQFRRAGLGAIVGKRSWGGVVGIYGRAPLIDGGAVNVPEAGSADPEGNWVIEGHGVEPDIEVTNLPRDILDGRDPQLEKAVDLLLEKLAEDPRTLPGRPADPIKTP